MNVLGDFAERGKKKPRRLTAAGTLLTCSVTAYVLLVGFV